MFNRLQIIECEGLTFVHISLLTVSLWVFVVQTQKGRGIALTFPLSVAYHVTMKIYTNLVKKHDNKNETHQKVQTKGRLKKYRDETKYYRQNRTFQNNERKFYRQIGVECMKTFKQPGAKEAKRFWRKIWERMIITKRTNA